MKRRCGKKATTVLTSLKHSTRPAGLEYLMNGARFASRYPNIKLMPGTLRNEAYHRHLEAMWRNVMQQTGRNADRVADIATLTQLVVGFVVGQIIAQMSWLGEPN